MLEPPKKYAQEKKMRPGEYRSAARGESWKFRLINTIDLCMSKARTRAEFLREMEKRCSMEELKKLNLPPEQTAPLTPEPCPTEEQWAELLSKLNALYRATAAQNHLLEQILSTPIIYATKEQAAEMTKQLSRIQARIEQVGRQNERWRLRLPRIHLPELPTVTLKGAALTLMVLVVLVILLYASVTVWNNLLKPLLALLQ